MQFCNLIKNFTFEGHQLNFNYCESEMDGPELFIYGDDASGKNFLEDDDNYSRVQDYIMRKWVNREV
jgi:hypothetical protein